jgi:ubiquinone/menaquinone biosynthesis C-methylase UbiE
LGHLLENTVAVDPEPSMLRVGQQRCRQASIHNMRWIRAFAEETSTLGIGPCRVVTFGQWFHQVRRLQIADAVFDLLAEGVARVSSTRGAARP